MRVWFVVAVAGCFQPHPPLDVPCGENDSCPTPQVCDRGTCVLTIDAPGPDDALVPMPDADLTCSCSGQTLHCGTGDTACALGCMPDNPGAHCLQLAPSNGVPITDTAMVATDIVVTGGVATLDTDTGAISGAVTRAAGAGIIADIAFESRTSGGSPLGVFTMHGLTVPAGAAIHFTGGAAAVLVIATGAQIGGTIDGSAGCGGMDLHCAGPGGGLGATTIPVAAATGCSPGHAGTSAMTTGGDSGGGGGGGGIGGGAGGDGSDLQVGGGAGGACIAATLEPLIGGSGGATGGQGAATVNAVGGGGGGALQISALGSITVTGTITMAGAGGQGGPPGGPPASAAAGGGGGAGGGVLLEAPTVTLGGVIAANGGGGGGGGASTLAGGNGTTGTPNATPAPGGMAPNTSNGSGGAGAAGATAATAGAVATNSNGGGGGGGAGVIYVRAAGAPTIAGTLSPAPGIGAIRTQ